MMCPRSAPAGTVPGNRLVRVVNALRAEPGGKRKRKRTKPGRNGSRGSSARHTTSAPAATDWYAKRNVSLARALGDRREDPGGSRRRLVQVAATTATAAAGRSAGSAPASTSQSTRKAAARANARTAALPAAPLESFMASLRDRARDAKRTARATALPA